MNDPESLLVVSEVPRGVLELAKGLGHGLEAVHFAVRNDVAATICWQPKFLALVLLANGLPEFFSVPLHDPFPGPFLEVAVVGAHPQRV